ncbi:pyridoxamine kinase [Streptococcus gordonii]|nr:pyridoxamine kinase [Streptococcus gordonii]
MIMTKPKRIILASDISGLGKVAVTAALPLFAVCQLEVSVLPTVLLSSHTGGFPNVYIDDYTIGMQAFLKQWQSLEIGFSALVTGYLRSSQQITSLIDFLERENIPLIVDPIMADNGKLYKGFDDHYISSMRTLCQKADLILPNLTEACFLADLPYQDNDLTEQFLKDLAQRLSELGAKRVLLTGLPLSHDQIGVAYFDKAEGVFSLYKGKRFQQQFFGTGDMLTGLVAAAFVQGLDLQKCLPVFINFIEKSLATTLDCHFDLRYGVYYQPHLGDLFIEFKRLLEVSNDK